jgi:pilus assembly protein CpaF
MDRIVTLNKLKTARTQGGRNDHLLQAEGLRSDGNGSPNGGPFRSGFKIDDESGAEEPPRSPATGMIDHGADEPALHPHFEPNQFSGPETDSLSVRDNGDRSDDFETELTFQRTKIELHELLLDTLNLQTSSDRSREQLLETIRRAARYIVEREATAYSEAARERMIEELIDEVDGLGPLEPLMRDPTVTDILVNHPYEIYVERRGVLEKTPVIFADSRHLLRIAQRLTSRVGRRVDESTPMVDARMPDGSRLNATIPPLAIDGATLSIRRFPPNPFTLAQLQENGTLGTRVAAFLCEAVRHRISMLISGGTGAGKTTLLNALASAVPADERIVTIEDSAELQLCHPHVVRLEGRVANTEGSGQVSARDLVRNALRMRPDRLIVGEVRGAEAVDMLQAMNTGHEGSFTTIHANDTRDSLTRLEVMVAMGGFDLPIGVIRQYIASGIRLIVHLARLKGGGRRVLAVSEIVGVKDGRFVVEDIFRFEAAGGRSRAIAGQFQATGHVPVCFQRMLEEECPLTEAMFREREPA